MDIPGLGGMTRDGRFGWYYSEPLSVPVLGGKMCRIVLEGYDEDPNKAEFHAAIMNFLSLDESVLTDSEPHLFHYYKDCYDNWGCNDDDFVAIESPSDVLWHVHFGSEPMVSRRANGDKSIYISLECECDWEEEHGLQIVFRNGLIVNKVGPFDGHLTNSDAYADDSLEHVVYRAIGA